MNYNPRYQGAGFLETIQAIEMVKQWTKDQEENLKDSIKKKAEKEKEEKEQLNWHKVIRYTVWTMMFGPWIVLVQYYGLTMAFGKLFR